MNVSYGCVRAFDAHVVRVRLVRSDSNQWEFGRFFFIVVGLNRA